MIYKISNKKEKTWQDKKFTEADLVDTNGECFTVSAWKGEFEGETWEGTLEKNDKGYYKLVSKKAQAGLNFKSAQIEQTMARKEQSIGKFQDNKQEAIALSSAQRDAVMIVNTLISKFEIIPDMVKIQAMIVEWRNWFLSSDFKDTPPF